MIIIKAHYVSLSTILNKLPVVRDGLPVSVGICPVRHRGTSAIVTVLTV